MWNVNPMRLLLGRMERMPNQLKVRQDMLLGKGTWPWKHAMKPQWAQAKTVVTYASIFLVAPWTPSMILALCRSRSYFISKK